KPTTASGLFVSPPPRLGFTTILDRNGHLIGVFSDGDLRRVIEAGHDQGSRQIRDLMTRGGTTINQGALAAMAARVMQERRINAVVVVDNEVPVGVLNMHDLLQAGVV
ncbi:MAG: CBS domain-containing protein, partial [Pseudomonadota bacterium]|nr:CBS domain-containing protein [Pseudomonadota bacterium]